MNMHSDQKDGVEKVIVVKRRSFMFPVLAVLTAGLVIAAILIPGQVDSRAAMNEASAIGSLRMLTSLQRRYAAANPSRGFTCELAQLQNVRRQNECKRLV